MPGREKVKIRENSKNNDSAGETGSGLWFVSYLLSNTAYGITIPLIPLFVILYLNSGIVYVGIAYSLASLASVPALMLWGDLSDSIRKRKIFVVIGFLGSFATLIPIVLVSDISEYILVLVAFQLVSMASVPVSNLLILENTKEEHWPKVMSSFSMISSLGTVAGLVAGTVIVFEASVGYARILPAFYLIASFIYLIAAISAVFLLKEPRRTIRRGRIGFLYTVRTIERVRFFPSTVLHIMSLRKTRRPKKLPRTLKGYICSSAILMFGFQLFILPFPVFLMNALGAGTLEIFIMYLFNAVLSTITFRIAGASVRKYGSRRTLSFSLFGRIGVFMASAALPLVILPAGTLMMISLAVYAVIGGFWSFISISQITYVSNMAESSVRGKAIGEYNSFFGIGQIGGSAISGILVASLGFSTDFIISAVVVGIGALLIFRFYTYPRVPASVEDFSVIEKLPAVH